MSYVSREIFKRERVLLHRFTTLRCHCTTASGTGVKRNSYDAFFQFQLYIKSNNEVDCRKRRRVKNVVAVITLTLTTTKLRCLYYGTIDVWTRTRGNGYSKKVVEPLDIQLSRGMSWEKDAGEWRITRYVSQSWQQREVSRTSHQTIIGYFGGRILEAI